MFIPKLYRNEHLDEIFEYLQKNNFGILVTTNSNHKIIGSHLPFVTVQKHGKIYLTAHVSKPNEQ